MDLSPVPEEESPTGFPAGIELGTSYGSYLFSRKSPRKPVVSNIPKLPTLPQVKEHSILFQLRRDFQLLVNGLTELHTTLKDNGITVTCLLSTIREVQDLLIQLTNSPDVVETVQVVLLYLQVITQTLLSTTQYLIHPPLINGTDELKTLRTLYQTTEAGQFIHYNIIIIILNRVSNNKTS